MSRLKISAKELRAIGYPESPVIPVAMNVMEKHFKHHTKEEAFEILSAVLQSPKDYTTHETLQPIAEKLLPKALSFGEGLGEVSLSNTGIHFNIFGREQIEEGAMHQMYAAAKLPVAVAGALMPDAHHGYGLPIGGVLATENAVIPYGVGVDIGCRMCLSIFDIDVKDLTQREAFFVRELGEATLFGSGAQFQQAEENEVMDNKLFFELPLLKSLHTRAWKQLGSSGSGNHFAEFGIIEIDETDTVLNVPAGKYVGFVTHSGSRALGANIANHYTRLAISKRRLPSRQDSGTKHLAWFVHRKGATPLLAQVIQKKKSTLVQIMNEVDALTDDEKNFVLYWLKAKKNAQAAADADLTVKPNNITSAEFIKSVMLQGNKKCNNAFYRWAIDPNMLISYCISARLHELPVLIEKYNLEFCANKTFLEEFAIVIERGKN